MSRITWDTAGLTAKVTKATVEAIDDITAEAAEDAARDHWWTSRSGSLESEIVSESCEDTYQDLGAGKRKSLGTIVGRFGATGPTGRAWIYTGGKSGFYGLFLERQTPFLRPAADRHFPQLPARIRERMAGE